jgi:hypothetical protein
MFFSNLYCIVPLIASPFDCSTFGFCWSRFLGLRSSNSWSYFRDFPCIMSALTMSERWLMTAAGDAKEEAAPSAVQGFRRGCGGGGRKDEAEGPGLYPRSHAYQVNHRSPPSISKPSLNRLSVFIDDEKMVCAATASYQAWAHNSWASPVPLLWLNGSDPSLTDLRCHDLLLAMRPCGIPVNQSLSYEEFYRALAVTLK